MKCTYQLTIMAGLILLAATVSAMPPVGYEPPTDNPVRNWDNDTYVNAANILMFVTNHGNFGRDLAGVFGYDAGTFYPFSTIGDIQSGLLTNYVLYAAGLWVGGKVNGQVRISVAEYSDEYVPGPMANGTYQPDDPAFKVYKLYSDSLAGNPNADYLNWPVDQGAPVNGLGQPLMLGDQMLWTVFNDANPDQHNNDAGDTDPLGIEIQQTVWATGGFGEDSIMVVTEIEVTQDGSTLVSVRALVTDQWQLTQDSYAVDVLVDPVDGPYWQLRNVTLGTVILADQTDFIGNSVYTNDGFSLGVTASTELFESFQVVANGDGPLDPPESGAAGWAGFPVPTDVDPDGYPTDGQQVGQGHWMFHTADNGGSSGGGTRGSYEAFTDRVTRGGAHVEMLGQYDFEMRFTGDNSNPGVGGSYAIEWFFDDNVFWVPFELWNIGIGTPNDPSDDYRLVPIILEHAGLDLEGDNIYALQSWGTEANGGGGWEHSVSGGDDDPYTDWVYWYVPLDKSPGESGYYANEAELLAGDFWMDLIDEETLARTVLVNWNGGNEPPFNQDCPEQGTVFRITMSKLAIEPDIFTFTPSTAVSIASASHNNVIYTKYKLYNKGGNIIEDAYISLWTDPDLGEYTDDLIGCDTMLDLFYCYNSDNDDAGHYGSTPPALGFRMLKGPIVPGLQSDTADFDGVLMPGYRNLPMTSFVKYINGTDPNNFNESYNYMKGLNANGTPYMYNGSELSYMHSGDPTTGYGDLDYDPADRRGMASFGPITMMPGDSQYVLIKMGVGHGPDRLSSITALKYLLIQPTPQSAALKAEVEPNPISMIMLNALEPIEAVVTFGYSDDGPVNEEIDFGSLVAGNLPPTDSTVILPGYPGFDGPVARFFFPLSDLLADYYPLWGVTVHGYAISGLYADGSPLGLDATVTIHGHRSGDLNLDGQVDISDLVFMVDYFFAGGPAPELLATADLDQSGTADITDLILMIEIMFGQ